MVVIGGGFGGLSAAIELANSGLEVDLIDPETELGGKVSIFKDKEGNCYDCGPTVVTLKDVFENLFSRSNENINEYVNFRQLNKIARHAWSENEVLDLYSEKEKSVEAVIKFAGSTEGKNFQEFSLLASDLFKVL